MRATRARPGDGVSWLTQSHTTRFSWPRRDGKRHRIVALPLLNGAVAVLRGPRARIVVAELHSDRFRDLGALHIQMVVMVPAAEIGHRTRAVLKRKHDTRLYFIPAQRRLAFAFALANAPHLSLHGGAYVALLFSNSHTNTPTGKLLSA